MSQDEITPTGREAQLVVASQEAVCPRGRFPHCTHNPSPMARSLKFHPNSPKSLAPLAALLLRLQSATVTLPGVPKKSCHPKSLPNLLGSTPACSRLHVGLQTASEHRCRQGPKDTGLNGKGRAVTTAWHSPHSPSGPASGPPAAVSCARASCSNICSPPQTNFAAQELPHATISGM